MVKPVSVANEKPKNKEQPRMERSISKSKLGEQVRKSLERLQQSCESVKSFKSIENQRVISELR